MGESSAKTVSGPCRFDDGTRVECRNMLAYSAMIQECAVFASIGREKSASVLNTVIQLLEPTLKDRSGNWTADYVRLRFAARKP